MSIQRQTPITRIAISDVFFRLAGLSDVDEIVTLVNSAYRGESSRAGWTTEADILGGQRTDAEEIGSLITRAGSAFLLCLLEEKLVGSVHMQRQDHSTVYIGMLVVKPGLQGQGLGRRLLREAERYAHDSWGAESIHMQVITLRHELIAYYERCGYRRTGEFRPFPASEPRFGLPKVDGLRFEVLEKAADPNAWP